MWMWAIIRAQVGLPMKLCPRLYTYELMPDGTVKRTGMGGSCERTLTEAIDVIVAFEHRVEPKKIGRVWIIKEDELAHISPKKS
jgi:hypothetical protein